MKISFPTATKDELERLKKLVKKVDNAPKLLGQRPKLVVNPKPPSVPEPNGDVKQADPAQPANIQAKVYYKKLFDGGIANVEVTREPLNIDNPAQLMMMLMPEVKLYPWQFEELMRCAGYLNFPKSVAKAPISDQTPYKLCLPAANGSGKDMVIIAACAVWFAATGVRNRVIITSSSFDQTKFQTEVHIRELVQRFNKKFGPLFKFNQFHYIIPEIGSEIKLFATDEPGRAEGYHPFPGGRMMLIMNEAKSIREELFDALSRCTGYSHWLEISSPGPRRGHMFRAAESAVFHPQPAVLGKFYLRRVTAYECPHIPQAHIEAMKYEKGENSPWFKSSVLAEFSDYDEPVIITDYSYSLCAANPPNHNGRDIGIGLDLAAGGDETGAFVRQGNKVIFHFFFRQEDTELAANSIHVQLSSWFNVDYVFRADDGGVGHAIIDKLSSKGWRILRTNNQSPAYRKNEFLNLGAEMYFYVKRLIERAEIILPPVPRLKDQLTTRRYKGEESNQGKFALESKKEARLRGQPSPDRADAFVLCFSTYRPNVVKKTPEGPKTYTIQELMQLAQRGLLPIPGRSFPQIGRFSQIIKL